ncbi:LacI family DNA-binding transcriptional regulator [Pseudomonas sp. BP8]|uniref:LacI family DNA-binding transcriptional regulator n=1 Tax=Pseudomonas sp. BP8 TaxID=2817864 RepID=UPI001AE3FC18|nr:LacI family DNA-binding transcriptional regulator [Pseudomonas sp. BP8]MBP2262342.1 LacI family transcriptional regulator [Pseudomonas sp. BP8]HDS1733257.1 LacI family DNA-binding transcriptional regulator [Pseudomonas putida]
MKGRPSVKRLMELTNLSRATIDRALNNRPGVHPRTIKAVDAAIKELEAAKMRHYSFKLIAQAGGAFTDSLIDCARSLEAELARSKIKIDVVACVGFDDEQVAASIRKAARTADGIGIISRNSSSIHEVLRDCIAKDLSVVSLVTDLNADVRHAYIGINNRAAGQSAAFLIGRHLEAYDAPNVAVVVANYSYSNHEDCEIGFRSLMRHQFPKVNVLEVVSGGDTDDGTYTETMKLIQKHGALDGIYNAAGGNKGLADALKKHGLDGKTIFVAHEINSVTEPLIKSGVIDYTLTKDRQKMLRMMAHILKDIVEGQKIPDQNILPIEMYSRFSLG